MSDGTFYFTALITCNRLHKKYTAVQYLKRFTNFILSYYAATYRNTIDRSLVILITHDVDEKPAGMVKTIRA